MRPGAAVGKLGFLAAVVWLAGCGGSPGRELADAARSAGSWAATAAAAGEGWHAGRLPAVYARQTAALAGEELRRLGREAG